VAEDPRFHPAFVCEPEHRRAFLREKLRKPILGLEGQITRVPESTRAAVVEKNPSRRRGAKIAMEYIRNVF
jgi:hypothetical protein